MATRVLRVWSLLLMAVVGLGPPAMLPPAARPAALPDGTVLGMVPGVEIGSVPVTAASTASSASSVQFDQRLRGQPSNWPTSVGQTDTDGALPDSLKSTSSTGAAMRQAQFFHREFSQASYALTASVTECINSLGAFVLFAIVGALVGGLWWRRRVHAVKSKELAATELATSSSMVWAERPNVAVAALASEGPFNLGQRFLTSPLKVPEAAEAPARVVGGSPAAASRRTERGRTVMRQQAASSPEGATGAGGNSRRAARRSPEATRAEGRQLLMDILEVVRSAGPQAGAVRSLQAARAGLATIADLARDGELNALLASFNSLSSGGQPDDELIARVLRTLFEKLGATYVKLGQFVASSPTLFPEAYVREFQKCLDKTETTPFSVIKRTVERELGRPLRATFKSFEEKPIASASIAQVHAAVLLTGEEVVVKVQKPGVQDVLQADLGFLYITARVLEFLNPEISRSSLPDIVSEIRTSMLSELDFGLELKNMETFQSFLEQNGLTAVAAVPKPYPEASAKRVLTMERFHGVPLIDLEGIQEYSANPEATLIAALNVWALSVRQCEIFHADVHAGNLLVLRDGRVGFIDFGIVGRVPTEIWNAVEGLGVAFVSDDPRGIARNLIAMRATDAEVDEVRLAEDVASLLASLKEIQPEVVVRGRQDGRVTAEVGFDDRQVTDLLLDLVRVTESNGLKLPREFALLVKQALYFDRYTKLLAPELDPIRDGRVDLGLGGTGVASASVIDV